MKCEVKDKNTPIILTITVEELSHIVNTLGKMNHFSRKYLDKKEINTIRQLQHTWNKIIDDIFKYRTVPIIKEADDNDNT